MALILIKDLNGAGNAYADGRQIPLDRSKRPPQPYKDDQGNRVHKADHLILHTAKAAGMVFSPWKIVPVPGGRIQEQKILRHCEEFGLKGQIVPVNWNDPEFRAEYFRRHPEEEPSKDTGRNEYGEDVWEMVQRYMSGETNLDPRRIPQGPSLESADISAKDADAAALSAAPDRGSRITAEERQARGRAFAAEQEAKEARTAATKAKAAANNAIYDEAFKAAVEKGMTEANAKRSAAAAVRRGSVKQ